MCQVHAPEVRWCDEPACQYGKAVGEKDGRWLCRKHLAASANSHSKPVAGAGTAPTSESSQFPESAKRGDSAQ